MVTPTPRLPLTRDRVLRAAVDLADRDGLEALTMRRLAGALGVEAMSLYHHVANKDALLGGMVELVVEEFALPPPEVEWTEALRLTATSTHDSLIRHAWAAPLLLSGPSISPARLRHMDAILGTLRRGGLSADQTDHAYHALDSHIMGYTLWQVGIAAGMERAGDVATLRDRLPLRELPFLAEHIEQHLKEPDPEDAGSFAFGLDLILDGLARLARSG